MPSPSAFSKFILSVLKFLAILKFLSYTQNSSGILKWANLCREIWLLGIPKLFWVYMKNWACLKNLSMLEPNFEEADGFGTSLTVLFKKCIHLDNHTYCIFAQGHSSNKVVWFGNEGLFKVQRPFVVINHFSFDNKWHQKIQRPPITYHGCMLNNINFLPCFNIIW